MQRVKTVDAPGGRALNARRVISSAADPMPVAVILAAGMGTRLSSLAAGQPKGLVAIGGEAIIARSVRTLQAAGIRDFVFVVGWQGDAYRTWCARHCPAAHLVENAAFATTGSLASLVIGAAAAPDRDLLIVESDLLYEDRAPRELLAAPARDTILVSGFTGSGDEVWVFPNAAGHLRALSKSPRADAEPIGELVGLTRLAAPTVLALQAAARALPAAAHYEDGLNVLAAQQPIALQRVADLIWCEIDDPAHFERARLAVWPRLGLAEATTLPTA
jgi:2-aminoethylphosphonate-pyruvate transaminase